MDGDDAGGGRDPAIAARAGQPGREWRRVRGPGPLDRVHGGRHRLRACRPAQHDHRPHPLRLPARHAAGSGWQGAARHPPLSVRLACHRTGSVPRWAGWAHVPMLLASTTVSNVI